MDVLARLLTSRPSFSKRVATAHGHRKGLGIGKRWRCNDFGLFSKRVLLRRGSLEGSSNFVYEQSDAEVNAPGREFSLSALRVFPPCFQVFSKLPALSDLARAPRARPVAVVIRWFALKLSDSLVNTPQEVNRPVPSGPRNSVFEILPILPADGSDP